MRRTLTERLSRPGVGFTRLGWPARLSLTFVALVVLVGLLSPLLLRHDPAQTGLGPALTGPTGDFWFGLDKLGRDVYSRLVAGTPRSLIVGFGAAGIALAAKMDGAGFRSFVILSDGECDEGAIWEAALFAGHHALKNLIALLDYNKIQSFGRTAEVLDLEARRAVWAARVDVDHRPAIVDDPARLRAILLRRVGDRRALVAVRDGAGDRAGKDDRVHGYAQFMIGAIILGIVAGFVGRLLMPGKDPMGFFATILLGLAGSVPGLVLVHVVYGLGFTTLYYRNYYAAFPTELVRAAMIDGAGFFRIFWRILLPVSGPITVVSVIWQFTNIWNDFLFGVSFGGTSQPMTAALNNLVQSSTGVKEYNVHFAGAIIAALPTLLVYVVAGRYFVRGLMAGSVKG